MICPKCGKDYKDTKPGQAPGRVYGVDDHFYREFKRFGVVCTNCGFVAEWVAKPTGESYLKRKAAGLMPRLKGRGNKRRKHANQEA